MKADPAHWLGFRSAFRVVSVFCVKFDDSPALLLIEMTVSDFLLCPCVYVLLSELFVSSWVLITLEIKAPRMFETSAAKTQNTRRHIVQDCHLMSSCFSANEPDSPSTDASCRLNLHNAVCGVREYSFHCSTFIIHGCDSFVRPH